MNEHRYILASNKAPKLDCPYCGAKKHWQRYIDVETGEVLPKQYGRCDNENKCGKWNDPYKDGYTKMIWKQEHGQQPYRKPNPIKKVNIQPKPAEPSFIPDEVFKQSLKGYEDNNLIKFLDRILGFEKAEILINLYKIGTSKRYGGGTTVFWQIDSQGNVRAGKLIKYAENGHRIHGKNNWVHSVLKLDNFNLKQCLFGEHILKHAPEAVVGLVESEKTAIVASAFIPDMVWLATGGAENLNNKEVKVLRGRNVILFPDASKDGRIYDKWKQKADEFGFNTSDLLEKETTPEQMTAGVDIADFLIKQKWNEWDSLQPASVPPEAYPTATVQLLPKSEQTDWSKEITEIESYFANTDIPTDPVKLNPWTTIINARLFIDGSMATVKYYNGNRYFRPYMNSLKEFKKLLTN